MAPLSASRLYSAPTAWADVTVRTLRRCPQALLRSVATIPWHKPVLLLARSILPPPLLGCAWLTQAPSHHRQKHVWCVGARNRYAREINPFLGGRGYFQPAGSLVPLCEYLWQREGGGRLGAGGRWDCCFS